MVGPKDRGSAYAPIEVGQSSSKRMRGDGGTFSRVQAASPRVTIVGVEAQQQFLLWRGTSTVRE
jgi:hypothetical protein